MPRPLPAVRRAASITSAMAMTLLVLLGAPALTGCAALSELAQAQLATAERPSASIRNVRLRDLTLDGVVLDFDVDVMNPYSVAIPRLDIGYSLASGGQQILDGRTQPDTSIPAGESRTIRVPAAVTFADLLAVLDGVRPGAVVPYTAEFDFGIPIPGGESISLPLSREGELPVPAVPEVAIERVAWSKLSLGEATAEIAFAVRNPNQFGLDLTEFDYGLDLGGSRVGTASVRPGRALEAGGERTITFPLSLRPLDLGFAAFRMLSGSSADYTIGGDMRLDTPFGPLTLPYEATGAVPLTRGGG